MLISKNGRKYSKSIPPDLVNEINKRFAEMQKRNRVSITKRFKHGKYNTIYVAILKSNDKHVAIIRTIATLLLTIEIILNYLKITSMKKIFLTTDSETRQLGFAPSLEKFIEEMPIEIGNQKIVSNPNSYEYVNKVQILGQKSAVTLLAIPYKKH
jgi:ABC-type branched-subunit amino acid transport system substrate-binding protein